MLEIKRSHIIIFAFIDNVAAFATKTTVVLPEFIRNDSFDLAKVLMEYADSLKKSSEDQQKRHMAMNQCRRVRIAYNSTTCMQHT